MNYTQEQQEVIDSNESVLIVNAFAGTGKTSTLVGYAAARPEKKMLYLAFNTGIATEARARFPSNVEARTSHSLAFAAVGYGYKNKLGNPRAKDVVEFLETVMSLAQIGVDRYRFAQAALHRVLAFFASSSFESDIKGPAENVIEAGADVKLNPRMIIEAARLVWASMKSMEPNSLSMPHDGYLKLYQLSSPDLSRKYDVLLLDEAQDTNPAVMSIVARQKMGKVIVGDRHQNIYGFRGAVNAMNGFDGHRLALTTSFRFNQEIADKANLVLGVFCGETDHRIKGLGREGGQIKTHAYLSRTNAGLFNKAVELMRQGKRMHFVGGLWNYNFETIHDAYKLRSRLGGIQDPFTRRFKSFDEFEEYAEAVKDKEILSRLKIVDKYHSAIPRLVREIAEAEIEATKATYFLTTAHKAKGLEWDVVELNDDFPEMLINGRPRTRENCVHEDEEFLTLDEANLIYVALTRGKKGLVPFQYFNDFEQAMEMAAESNA